MRTGWILMGGLLLTLSCQPYLDHPPAEIFSAERGVGGTRRRLSVSHLEGASDSLLVVFNQPLHRLGEGTNPAFSPQVLPDVPLESVEFEGAAGVRLKMGRALAPTRSYLARIPAGWQALTGAALSHDLERRWTVPSPSPTPESASPAAQGQGEELTYLGSRSVAGQRRLQLRFSSSPTVEEVQRCLVCAPWQTRPKVEATEDGELFLRFGPQLPISMSLLAGLSDREGRTLQETVEFELPQNLNPFAAPTSSGRLRLASRWVARGETFPVMGATSSDLRKGTLRLLDSDSKVLWEAALSWQSPGPFVARVPAPKKPGKYQLAFSPPDGSEVWLEEFWSCQTAEKGESYSLTLEPGTDGGLPQRAVCQRTGARHRELKLRAFLHPSSPEKQAPSEWALLGQDQPNWKLLGESSGEELTLDPTSWGAGGTLVVEAVDRSTPDLVLARQTQEIPASSPQLRLSKAAVDGESTVAGALLATLSPAPEDEEIEVEGELHLQPRGQSDWVEVARHERFDSAPWMPPLHRPGRYRLALRAKGARGRVWECTYQQDVLPWSSADSDLASGEQTAPLEIGRADGKEEALHAGEKSQVSGPPDGVIGWSEVLPGWTPSQSSSEGPSGVPLLPWRDSSATEMEGERLSSQGQATLLAPTESGLYRLWSVASGTGLLQETVVKIEPSPRWSVLGPPGVRAGDRFRAGPEFSPGPLGGSVGLTASSSDVGLIPSGFLSTAGVAKGSEQALWFDYRAPEEAATLLTLGWRVGRGGFRQELSTQIPVWSIAKIPHASGQFRLAPKEKGKRRVSGAWRLMARVVGDQRATLIATDPTGGQKVLELEPNAPAVGFEGAKAGTVRVEHRSGKGLVDCQWWSLEPDQGAVSPWASRAYLDRMAVDGENEKVESWKAADGMAVVLSLVNPGDGLSGEVELPLPAGVEPIALRPMNGQATECRWTYVNGSLCFAVEALPAGESLWKIDLEGRAGGDYLWPSARLVSPRGDLWSLSSSSRVRIDL